MSTKEELVIQSISVSTIYEHERKGQWSDCELQKGVEEELDEVTFWKIEDHLTLTNDFFYLELREFISILKFVHVFALISYVVRHNLLFLLLLLSLILFLIQSNQVRLQLGLKQVVHLNCLLVTFGRFNNINDVHSIAVVVIIDTQNLFQLYLAFILRLTTRLFQRWDFFILKNVVWIFRLFCNLCRLSHSYIYIFFLN